MGKENPYNPNVVCLGEIHIGRFPSEVGRKLAGVFAFLPNPGGGSCQCSSYRQAAEDFEWFYRKRRQRRAWLPLDRSPQTARGASMNQPVQLAFIALPNQNMAEFTFWEHGDKRMLPEH
jgi:hypothetical protein